MGIRMGSKDAGKSPTQRQCPVGAKITVFIFIGQGGGGGGWVGGGGDLRKQK